MSAERERLMAEMLLPALEVMTAFTQSHDDPGFYWQAIQRVLADHRGTDEATAVAGLTFGLSALAGILLDDLGATTGREPAQILTELHRRYLAAGPPG